MYQPQPDLVRVLVTDRMERVRADLTWSRARRVDRRHLRLRRTQRRRREVTPATPAPMIPAVRVR